EPNALPGCATPRAKPDVTTAARPACQPSIWRLEAPPRLAVGPKVPPDPANHQRSQQHRPAHRVHDKAATMEPNRRLRGAVDRADRASSGRVAPEDEPTRVPLEHSVVVAAAPMVREAPGVDSAEIEIVEEPSPPKESFVALPERTVKTPVPRHVREHAYAY